MTFYKLLLTVCITLTPIIGFAETTIVKPCTREAMNEINQSNEKYINYFAKQNNSQAIDEIRAIRPPESFLTRHQAELEMLAKDKTYQPSQSLCDDIYTIEVDLEKSVKAVAEKYNYTEEVN